LKRSQISEIWPKKANLATLVDFAQNETVFTRIMMLYSCRAGSSFQKVEKDYWFIFMFPDKMSTTARRNRASLAL